MFKNRKREIKNLLESFREELGSIIIDDLFSYLDQGEYLLTIEMLSSGIYDNDISVNSEQESEMLRISEIYGLDADFHSFIGRTPPYPDLRTPEQIEQGERMMNPSLENVEYFAKIRQPIQAIKMYRGLTGAGLAEAKEYVDNLSNSSTDFNDE